MPCKDYSLCSPGSSPAFSGFGTTGVVLMPAWLVHPVLLCRDRNDISIYHTRFQEVTEYANRVYELIRRTYQGRWQISQIIIITSPVVTVHSLFIQFVILPSSLLVSRENLLLLSLLMIFCSQHCQTTRCYSGMCLNFIFV